LSQATPCSSLADSFTVRENLSASKPMWGERGHDSVSQDFLEAASCGLADSLFRISDETVVELTHIKHYGS
jgi:hypothetical protein